MKIISREQQLEQLNKLLSDVRKRRKRDGEGDIRYSHLVHAELKTHQCIEAIRQGLEKTAAGSGGGVSDEQFTLLVKCIKET